MSPGISSAFSRTLSVPEDTTRTGKTFDIALSPCLSFVTMRDYWILRISAATRSRAMSPGISGVFSRTLSVPEDTTRTGKAFFVDLAPCKCIMHPWNKTHTLSPPGQITYRQEILEKNLRLGISFSHYVILNDPFFALGRMQITPDTLVGTFWKGRTGKENVSDSIPFGGGVQEEMWKSLWKEKTISWCC